MKLAWDSKKPVRGKMVERERSAAPYHSFRWTKLARAWKAEHPLCAQCLKEGKATPAEIVDHIVPFPVCGDFFDRSNLQSLCSYHNNQKGNKDKAIIRVWKQAHSQ